MLTTHCYVTPLPPCIRCCRQTPREFSPIGGSTKIPQLFKKPIGLLRIPSPTGIACLRNVHLPGVHIAFPFFIAFIIRQGWRQNNVTRKYLLVFSLINKYMYLILHSFKNVYVNSVLINDEWFVVNKVISSKKIRPITLIQCFPHQF